MAKFRIEVETNFFPILQELHVMAEAKPMTYETDDEAEFMRYLKAFTDLGREPRVIL